MDNVKLELLPPWLVADLGSVHDMLSWSLNKPGFCKASRVVWREVRNADLSRETNAKHWLIQELDKSGLSDAVALITSRGLNHHLSTFAETENVTIDCVATIGLSNAERIGRRRVVSGTIGTINLLVRSSAPLTEAAMVEAVSIAAEARTVAIVEAGHDCGKGIATGTGTDCIVVAAPCGPAPHAYAGLHTPLGEALGRAVMSVIKMGVDRWLQEQLDHLVTDLPTVV